MKLKILKRYILRMLLCCFAVTTILIFNKYCYCISDNFKFIIDTIGIPEYNAMGDRINENIYYTYNIFVYSDPVEIGKRTNLQRFKIVNDNGKWIQKDTLDKGEYYILGTNYSGGFVTNVYFPVDFVPETLPNNWMYIHNVSAIESWQDNSKYKYVEQLEYMKNSNLWFDKIDYENNTCNSYDLVEYDINANSIGLDKVVLENSATWKTYGSVSVNRKTNDNKVRYATFFVKPMSASADVKSKLEILDNIVINESDEDIDIMFGANAINLSDYAKEEHIKEINSQIYINDEKIDEISIAKSVSINKTVRYKISSDSFEGDKKVLNIKVKSYLYTEFSVDGLMQDVMERNITIHKDISNEETIVPADNIFVKILERLDDEYIVKDLIKTHITDISNSIGIVEKGRSLAVKIIGNCNIDSNNINVYINGNKLKHDILNISENCMVIRVNIENNYMILNTIVSWKYLRDLCNNYLNIQIQKIGNRIKKPNVVTIKVGSDEYNFLLDVIDNFIYNINYTFLDKIINIEQVNNKIRLEEWVIM